MGDIFSEMAICVPKHVHLRDGHAVARFLGLSRCHQQQFPLPEQAIRRL
jgi:hypothetical protein